jgi:hypothetical protein
MVSCLREFNSQPTKQNIATILKVGRREGRLQIYTLWQGMPIVEKRRADKATVNEADSVTKCQERTASLGDTGLQNVQTTQ